MSSARLLINQLITLIELTNSGPGNSQNPKNKNQTSTKPNGQNKWKKNGKIKTMGALEKQRLVTRRSSKVTSSKISRAKNKNGKKWKMSEKGNRSRGSISERSLRETIRGSRSRKRQIPIVAIRSIKKHRVSNRSTIDQ